MAIRKKASIKSKLKKILPKNLWECKKCCISISNDYTQEDIQLSPDCNKCGDKMILVGLSGSLD